MSEQTVIERTSHPITRESMVQDLRQLGLSAGQTVLVHSSLSKIGWIVGGVHSVILALLDVLGKDGTLMMPTHSAQNTNPSNWQNPPVPEAWWQTIREHRPAYDPDITPTREMGALPELFRTLPDVKRSQHPIGSFAALGPNAEYLLKDHDSLEKMFADDSPIGKLYQLDGYVLLLGVGHGNNTSIHLAEYQADFPGKKWLSEATAMMVNGKREWVEFQMHGLDDEDFEQIGADYEAQHPVAKGKVGNADTRLLQQRPLVDFAVDWMNANRT